MLRTLKIIAVTCCVVAAGFGDQSPADAKKPIPPYSFTDLGTKYKKKTVTIKQQQAKVVVVKCPRKTYPYTGGGHFHLPGGGPNENLYDDAVIATSYPDVKKRAWVVAGVNFIAPNDAQMTAEVRCSKVDLSKESLDGGITLGMSPNGEAQGSSSCTSGVRVLAGAKLSGNGDGARTTEDDAFNARISSAGFDDGTFVANAVNVGVSETRFIFVDKYCSTVLGAVTTVTEEVDRDPGGWFRGLAQCPGGYGLLGGGAVFVPTPGGDPDFSLASESSVVSLSPFVSKGQGFFAYGRAIDGPGQDIRMKVTATCLAF